MNLISKIYLSFGFILFVFVLVTLIYFRQSNKVEVAMEQVLRTTEIIKTNDNVLRAVLNAQTGLRGFILSGKENFLTPYHEGVADYYTEVNKLEKYLDQNPGKDNWAIKLEQNFKVWNDTVALPIISAKQKIDEGAQAQIIYNRLFSQSYDFEKGKVRIDSIRLILEQIEMEQLQNRKSLLIQLNKSKATTDFLAPLLTLVAVIIGLATAYVLGRSIKNRMVSMKNLAQNLAKENFEVQLTDHYQDELSSLSSDMNIMAQKLQKSFVRLKKMNQELDQFAYVVSHDLKAPLRAINNLSEWILEDIGETTPDIQKNLTLMRGRVHRMEKLIDGILAYSRIGRQEIEKTNFNVRDLLQEIIESIAPPAHFTIIIPTEPFRIKTEKILLHQVLLNLISNAIKYNNKAQGEIKVDISVDGQLFEFKVMDNGPGIPPEYHQKIFGVFQTIEARDTIESTGIGLAIVKKIIEEKNGHLSLISAPNEGTTFTFTWPQTHIIHHPENTLLHVGR